METTHQAYRDRFQLHHWKLHEEEKSRPSRRHLGGGVRACWFLPVNSSDARWREGIAQSLDLQPDYTGVVLEDCDGSLISLPAERVRFTPPPWLYRSLELREKAVEDGTDASPEAIAKRLWYEDRYGIGADDVAATWQTHDARMVEIKSSYRRSEATETV